MEREVYIVELLELLRLAGDAQIIDPLHGVSLYNPTKDEEYSPIEIDAGCVAFHDTRGTNRSIPLAAISQWSAIIPSESVLNSESIIDSTGEAKRKSIVGKMNALGLMSSAAQSLEDIQSILNAWNTPLSETSLELRKGVYRAIKKMENEPEHANKAFQLGCMIMERWFLLPLSTCPPDYLIQLAYYRRWTKRTDAALEVTALIEHSNIMNIMNKFQISVLATERAAAYMDKYEQTNSSLDQALRFLRYHHKLMDGKGDLHNANAWKRYDALKRSAH
jgi:hypothetical protein